MMNNTCTSGSQPLLIYGLLQMVLNPVKNVTSSITVGIDDLFLYLSCFCRAREVNPEPETTCRRRWKPLVQLS